MEALTDNGCRYGACKSTTNSDDWTCVYASSFCVGDSIFRTASEVSGSGRTCQCKDLLSFPSLIGVCDSNGVLSPMAIPSDCSNGTPFCAARAAEEDEPSVFPGDPDIPFTACDLPCFHGNGHMGAIPEDTYQTCEVPSFEWAAISAGNDGSMAGNNVAATVVIVAGEIYGTAEFRGPFTAADPTGSSASATVEHSVPLEDVGRPWDAAFLWINAQTGEPIRVVSVPNPDTAYVHAFGISPGGDLMAMGGEFAPGTDGMKGTTRTCTVKSFNDGGAVTQCGEDGTTILKPHVTGWPGYIVAANPGDGEIQWMIQAPWLQLSDKELLSGRTLSEHSVLGIQIGSDKSLYVTGFKALVMKEGTDPPAGEPATKYTGIVCKLNGDTGEEIWRKEYPELKYAIKSDLDEADNAFFFAAEMDGSQEQAGELGVTCENPAGGGCSLLIRISTENGALDWVRIAHGFNDRPWESSEVHLGHQNGDAPYVYAAFQEAGVHGPTYLDAGSPYAGCQFDDGTVIPEYDDQFSNIVLDASACAAIGGTFFSRTSESAIPAYAAKTGAHCMGYEATSCLVKFNKKNGLPIWGATKPRISSFIPQSDGITAIGSATNGGSVFDTVNAGGPRGHLDGTSLFSKKQPILLTLTKLTFFLVPLVAFVYGHRLWTKLDIEVVLRWTRYLCGNNSC